MNYIKNIAITIVLAGILGVIGSTVQAQTQCPAALPATSGMITFNTTVPSTGDYFVYTRLKAPSLSNNKLLIVVGQACHAEISATQANIWQWVPYKTQFSTATLTIKLAATQDGMAVDRILLVPTTTNGETTCVPIDKGDNCAGATTITPSVTTPPGECPKKFIGDADCQKDANNNFTVSIFDYAIWYSEFIKDCSISKLDGCGADSDKQGNAMDANFNYPGTNYITTDEKVSIFDYAVWIQGITVGSGTTAPTFTPAPQDPTRTPTPTPGTGGKQYPAQVLDLTNWKITMPYDKNDDGKADEVKPPQIATFTDPDYFYVSPAGNSVIFKAHAGGATTSGSGYPRSELRERTSDGTADIAWSASSGKHTMFIDQRVNHLPVEKPHIVVGQIHGGSDDLTVFRLEGNKLFIDIGGSDGPVLSNNYQLGTRFTVKFEVQNNQVKYYYNNALVPFTLETNVSGAYFKAGAYTQSACQGDKKVPDESCDAYGEVEIFDVKVTHE